MPTAAQLAWRMQQWELLVLVGGSLPNDPFTILAPRGATARFEAFMVRMRASAGTVVSNRLNRPSSS